MPKFGQSARRSVIVSLVAVGLGAAPVAARAGLECSELLKTSEVEEAIGPHTIGEQIMTPGGGVCEWFAKSPSRPGSEFHDRITLNVYAGNKLAWARDQVRGEAVEGVAKNAKWARMYGEMWFDCAGGRVCVVKLSTSRSKQQQAIATKLVKLVDGRVR